MYSCFRLCLARLLHPHCLPVWPGSFILTAVIAVVNHFTLITNTITVKGCTCSHHNDRLFLGPHSIHTKPLSRYTLAAKHHPNVFGKVTKLVTPFFPPHRQTQNTANKFRTRKTNPARAGRVHRELLLELKQA